MGQMLTIDGNVASTLAAGLAGLREDSVPQAANRAEFSRTDILPALA